MKRIHFNNLGKDFYWLILIILSLVLVLVGLFEPFEIENPKLYHLISSFGFFLQALYFIKLFWYRNTVQWNKKGIVIRIKSVLGKTLRFDEIKATEFNDNTLTISKTDGEKLVFDMAGFSEADTHKLNEIVTSHTTTTK